VLNAWKLFKRTRGLDDYGFFVELDMDEIDGGLYYQ
jgi:hypothetical protein